MPHPPKKAPTSTRSAFAIRTILRVPTRRAPVSNSSISAAVAPINAPRSLCDMARASLKARICRPITVSTGSRFMATSCCRSNSVPVRTRGSCRVITEVTPQATALAGASGSLPTVHLGKNPSTPVSQKRYQEIRYRPISFGLVQPVEFRAHTGDVLDDLVGAHGHDAAQALRRFGIGFKHLQEQVARDTHHGRRLGRGRGGRRWHLGEKGEFAQQGSGTNHHGLGCRAPPPRLKRERPFLHHITGIGRLAF